MDSGFDIGAEVERGAEDGFQSSKKRRLTCKTASQGEVAPTTEDTARREDSHLLGIIRGQRRTDHRTPGTVSLNQQPRGSTPRAPTHKENKKETSQASPHATGATNTMESHGGIPS